MAIRTSKVEETQFTLFGTVATITLILFANTDEDGGNVTPFLQYLVVGFLLTLNTLLSLVIYVFVIDPLVFGVNKTSDDGVENDDQELTTNSDAFNIADSGALNIGSV